MKNIIDVYNFLNEGFNKKTQNISSDDLKKDVYSVFKNPFIKFKQYILENGKQGFEKNLDLWYFELPHYESKVGCLNQKRFVYNVILLDCKDDKILFTSKHTSKDGEIIISWGGGSKVISLKDGEIFYNSEKTDKRFEIEFKSLWNFFTLHYGSIKEMFDLNEGFNKHTQNISTKDLKDESEKIFQLPMKNIAKFVVNCPYSFCVPPLRKKLVLPKPFIFPKSILPFDCQGGSFDDIVFNVIEVFEDNNSITFKRMNKPVLNCKIEPLDYNEEPFYFSDELRNLYLYLISEFEK